MNCGSSGGQVVKGEEKWLNADDTLLATYNCWDTLATAQLAVTLRERLFQRGQLSFYEAEVWTQIPAIMAMQKRGIPFSDTERRQVRRELRAELRQCDDALTQAYYKTASLDREKAACTWQFLVWAGVLDLPGWPIDKNKPGAKAKVIRRRPAPFTKGEWERIERRLSINLDSDPQLRRWLFEDLELKVATRTKKAKLPSVDLDALNRILQRLRKMDEHARPILYDLMHRARLAKIDQDYLDPPIVDGFVYPTIKMAGTETGRFAYSDPPAHSWPDEVRRCIVAPDGYLIVEADYSAVEARIFAHLTKDQAELELFEQNRLYPDDPQWDIHIRTACELFGWSLQDFLTFDKTKQKASRNTAKTFQYGVKQYGGRPETAKTKVMCGCPRCVEKAPPVIDLTVAEKTRQARRWFQRHYNVLHWRAGVSREVRLTHRLTNRFGQVRYFTQPWDPHQSPNELEREAWNYLIQSAATCILRRAMRQLHDAGVALFMEHHDSLKALAPTQEALDVAATMKRLMERPVPEFGGAVFPVEVKVGPSYPELKKVHF
jgi:DNA polymerase I-like protein with 3'-5' exonuclease and polymerase domains